jgi:hypothetical protein
MGKQGMHFDTAFPLAERSPGEKRQAQLDGSGVQAESLDLKRNLCLGAWGLHNPYISANKSWKKPTVLELLASTKVERATFFNPQRYRRFPAADKQRKPSRMERRAAR